MLCKHQVIGSIPIGSTSFQVPENVRGTFSLKTPERKRGYDGSQISKDEDANFLVAVWLRGGALGPSLTL